MGAEPQEFEPFAHAPDAGLPLRAAQAQRREPGREAAQIGLVSPAVLGVLQHAFLTPRSNPSFVAVFGIIMVSGHE